MGIFDMFKKKKGHSIPVTLQLNARLQPMHRFEFEEMLTEVFKEHKFGEITGGGSFVMPTGEIANCDIEFDIAADKVDEFVSLLGRMRIIPKGSIVRINDEDETNIGVAEGLALRLNGTDLPVEVYQNNDINALLEQLDNALSGIAVRLSFWEGPKDTVLYYYGEDFTEMKERITPIVANHPLCERCVLERIA